VDSLGAVLPFIVILGAFYLLLIRPARNKQRAQATLQSKLQVGVEVMLTSGLYGTVAAIDGDVVVLETSPGVTMRWAKPAVARILTPAEPVSGDDGDLGDRPDAEPADDGSSTPDGTAGTESTEQR
jgi:preprotein translocase subunit YajC